MRADLKLAKQDELEERLLEVMDARARRHMLAYTLATKPNFNANWHHRILCRYLDKLATGEITRLMVFMPPRHGKSELVSRRFPSFCFGIDPNIKIIGASYSADLASLMNRDVQRIIDSDSYHRIFPETQLSGDMVRKTAKGSYLRNSDMFEIVGYEGSYRSVGIGGGITGMGADLAIIDDPIKNHKEADSLTYRNSVFEWIQSTLMTRLEKMDRVLLTVTRWHEDDVAGRLLKLAEADPEADQWVVLNFPAIKESRPARVKPWQELSYQLDKREEGEELWGWKYPLAKLQKRRSTIGSRFWNSLYQQRPSASEGGHIKRSWFRYYKVLPAKFDEMIQTWDTSFKDSSKADFVAGHVWGRLGAQKYLIHRVHARMDFVDTLAAIRNVSKLYPRARAKYVEDTANGPAIIQSLRDKIPGIIAYKPEGSKESRVSAVQPEWEAGNVFTPDPEILPSITEYIEELATFPNAAHDDDVDAMTCALLQLERGSGSLLSKLTTM